MKCYVGFGSNLGDKLANLERAASLVAALPGASRLRVSPVFRTPALVPPGAPDSWLLPFLNAVAELEWRDDPRELLRALKRVERELGRVSSPTWSPRVIDLDLLVAEGVTVDEPDCRVPHSALASRAFVLDPLKHLAPGLRLPSFSRDALGLSRCLERRSPLWLAILNLTPDSFSDGGELTAAPALAARVEKLERAHVQCLDLGAESTRPGASPVTEAEEWARLAPALDFLADRYRGRWFRPSVSVDTRRAVVAARALERGATIVNDVSGLDDPGMPELLAASGCEYILMHSLSVPADRSVVLAETADPVVEVRRWAEEKLAHLARGGVKLDRVYFDPGLGFGKTTAQCLALLRGIDRFFDLPVRILVGHSRKGFLGAWGPQPTGERDGFGVGVSLHLAARGVEAIRVHEAQLHATAHYANQELSSS